MKKNILSLAFLVLVTLISHTSYSMQPNQEELNRSLVMEAGKGNLEKVKSLLQKGADLNQKAFGPLKAAISGNQKAVVQYLVSLPNLDLYNDAKQGPYSALWLAASSVMYIEYLKLLIKAGINVNGILSYNYTHSLKTALMVAAENDDSTRILETLIAANANVNAQDIYGQTPLFYAAMKNKLQNVFILLKAGANPLLSAYFERINFDNDQKYIAVITPLMTAKDPAIKAALQEAIAKWTTIQDDRRIMAGLIPPAQEGGVKQMDLED